MEKKAAFALLCLSTEEKELTMIRSLILSATCAACLFASGSIALAQATNGATGAPTCIGSQNTNCVPGAPIDNGKTVTPGTGTLNNGTTNSGTLPNGTLNNGTTTTPLPNGNAGTPNMGTSPNGSMGNGTVTPGTGGTGGAGSGTGGSSGGASGGTGG